LTASSDRKTIPEVQAKAVSLALAGLAAAGVAVAARTSTAVPTSIRTVASSDCDANGDAVGVLTPVHLPKLLLNGKSKHSKKSVPLHAHDALRSMSGGAFDFCLVAKEADCSTIPGTRLRVMPAEDVLIRLNAGRASCSTGPGSNMTIKAGKGPLAKLTPADDPVFSVSVTPKGRTIVKVFVGAVAVAGSTGQAPPVVVGAGMQTLVPKAAAPAPPTTITLAQAEKKTLQKLTVQLPKPGLGVPDRDDSKALQTIAARNALVADLDRETLGDRRVEAFAVDLLSSLANAWDAPLQKRVTSPSGAAADLAKGAADVYVTSDPSAATAAGLKLGLADAAGVAAVPFVTSGKTLIQLATRADAGLAAALRQYLSASALQSKIYANAYSSAFGGRLPYGQIGDLAFPTAGHVSGVETDVKQGFAAVANAQLAPGLKVSGTAKGTCSAASTASWRVDAWACTDTTGRQWDPCFSGIQNMVVCPSDPPITPTPVNVLELSLTKPLPRISRLKRDPIAGPARRIQTTGRTICQPLATAKSSFGTQPITYQCLKGPNSTAYFLAGEAYRAGMPWKILAVPANWQRTPSVADAFGISAIWFW
jgi:hypothetical protein